VFVELEQRKKTQPLFLWNISVVISYEKNVSSFQVHLIVTQHFEIPQGMK